MKCTALATTWITAWFLAFTLAPAVRAAETRVQSVQSGLARAQAFLDRADARSALSVIQDVENDLGNDGREWANILRLKGYVLVLLRRDTEAEETFRKLLRVVPEDEYGHLELAKRLHARAAYAEARRHYQFVLAHAADQTGSNCQDASSMLGNLAREEKNHAEVAARIRNGERNLLRAAGLTMLVLVVFGFLLRFLLRV